MFFALFWKFWLQLDQSVICEFQVFCYISVSCIWRFVKLLFSQKFSKNFSMRSFFKNCLHDITVLSQTFWLSRKRNGLERRCPNRQFPPNVKFLHRNSVSLDKLPTFRKKIICKKHKKKSPVGHLAHWGFFFDPSSQTSFACVILR